MASLQLKFFNSLSTVLNGVPINNFRSSKVQGLLVYLALQADRAHTRDVLATLFWPDKVEARARQNLRQSLYQLRHLLDDKQGTEFLSITRQTVRFGASDDYSLDVQQFESAVRIGSLSQALDLYAGELLPGFTCNSLAFEGWLRAERERIHRLALKAMYDLTEQQLESGDAASAQAYARRQLMLEPWREIAHQQLMRALALAGDRSAALAQYDVCIKLLWDELGVEVSAETDNLYQQIRQQNTFAFPSPIPKPLPVPTPNKPNRFKVRSRLEALPDQMLFGIDKARNRIVQALSQPNRRWIVAIDGLGGLGKTTLANAVVEHFIDSERFVDIGWVSAKQEEFVTGRGIQSTRKAAIDAESLIDQLLAQLADGPYPTGNEEAKHIALAQILQEKTCLIVIDNLETAIDYEVLLPLMRMLGRPSKFLITSRRSLQFETDVFCHSVQELESADALALLRHEAKEQHIPTLLHANEQALNDIYTTVGGNPLALKLVIGQSQFLPLPRILEQLRLAKSRQIDQLYNYIYWQAWQMLDQTARNLWISLPLMPNGTFDQLMTASQLDALDVQTSLEQLKSLSLVQVGGDYAEPRYRLHRLTETFLLNEVLKWGNVIQTTSNELTLFENRIQGVATHWQEDQAIRQMDVATLDREKDVILTAIRYGLAIEAAWPAIKAIIFALTNYMERRGHWETWLQTLEQAIAVTQTVQDIDSEIALTNLRGRVLQRQSRPHDVIHNYWRVIRLARKHNNQIEEARACSNLGYAYIAQNLWWRSETLCCHAMGLFRQLKHQHGVAHTHNHLGSLYIHQGKWQQANTHLNHACKIWKATNDIHGLIRGYENLGYLYNEMGQPSRAIEHLEQAAEYGELTGETSGLAGNYINLAFAYRLQSDYNALAENYAKQAESIFKGIDDLHGLCLSWVCLGAIYSGQGLDDSANTYFQASLEGYTQLNNQDGVLRVQVEQLRHAVSYQRLDEARQIANRLKDIGLNHFKGLSRTRLEALLSQVQ